MLLMEYIGIYWVYNDLGSLENLGYTLFILAILKSFKGGKL